MSDKIIDSAEAYCQQVPVDRREAFLYLRKVLLDHLPPGFEEQMSYGMITYVVPHDLFPPGYHVDPRQPLPFISIANQKSHIAIYHMGLYAFPAILDWFQEAYPKHSSRKLDIGKSCIRFKHFTEIPFTLLAELVSKITVKEWIRQYQSTIK